MKEYLRTSRLASVLKYLRKLLKNKEIDEATFQLVRPKAAKPARAHGLQKIHKKFDKIPKLRPIVDTTGTTHYEVGKFLSQLLQPLTKNEHTVKDTFDAKLELKQSIKLFLTNGTNMCHLMLNPSTNVPLERTLAIIERRIYDENELATTLKKTTPRKLIRDTCKKTIFSCDGIYYEQIDGVSMGGSLILYWRTLL